MNLTLIRNLLLLSLLINIINIPELFAQQGKVDKTFNTLDDGTIGDGFNNTVRTLLRQSDGKLLVGGDYTHLNGVASPYLTRLNTDGSIDDSFNLGTGLNGKVYSSCLQPDGKIIIGGSFTTYNGVSAGRLIRLNQDGSQDPSFNTSIGATTGIIYKIGLQPDGKIIIVGSFTKYNNTTVNRVARILPDGTLDPSFNIGTGSSLNITNAEILSDGKILLAGTFTVFNGAAANRIVRLHPDGEIDNSFNCGIAFDDDVNAIALQSDGKIVLGGKFTSYNGITANRLIRINSDGTPDLDFLTGSGFSKEAVQVIKIDESGSIMAGGSFTGSYNNTDVNRVLFLNPDGTLKNDFDIGNGPGSASVLALENDTDGSWYIGGSFSVFDNLNQGRLAKVNSNGEHDIAYLSAGVGFDNAVQKVLPLPNKQTIVLGNFNKFNGTFASKIARLLENGTLDTTFNSQQTGASSLIKTGVLQADDKIVLGGNFTKYNGTACNRIIRILPDGAIDETFSLGSGFNAQVYTMAIQADQKIIAAGNFTSYNGRPAGRIVRLLPNGLADESFNAGLGANAIIDAVLVQPDGKILVGGRFTSFDGNLFSGLIRLKADGSRDTSFYTGNGFDKNVYALALQSDQKIIVGGSFQTYNGIVQKRILRLNPDGSLDATFDSGTGFSKGDVLSILVQPDDRILVGGTFSGTYKSKPSLRLLRLLKTGDYDVTFQASLNNKLNTMNFTSDQKLMIGGDFNAVSADSKHRIARLKICLEATTWDGISWSNGLPSGGKQVFFKESYSDLKTTRMCSCSIDLGKIVSVSKENTLGIEFDYNGLGTLVLNDKAGLYQDDDEIVNTGEVHAIKDSSPILKYDYTYWSSPVQNQKLLDVSPNTLSDKFFSFDYSINDWKIEKPTDSMVAGKGYNIRGPQDFSETVPSFFEATFKGIPNNGKISIPLGDTDSYNLIGNPYPSAIEADFFLDQNSQNINPVIYFWTHNTPIADYSYNANDYAVYNLLGGVGTRKALTSGINETVPDGTISSGQAFFVCSKKAGTAEFSNSMRITGKNSIFFKPVTKESKEAAIVKHRLWLDLENTDGIFKQTLIGYVQNSERTADDYSAESLNGNQFADFYSIRENKKFVIQGFSNNFEASDSIQLGYSSAVNSTFTIRIDHKDGLFEKANIYIEDKTLKIIHNLNEKPYQFTTGNGTFNGRFVIHYIDKTLKTEKTEKKPTVLVTQKNKTITITSPDDFIKEVDIYDISGKQLFSKNKIQDKEINLSNLPFSEQVLIVKITLGDTFFNQKIIYR